MNSSNKNHDYTLAVIGGGPAGMTAAIYAKRAGIDVVVFENSAPGGNLLVTQTVENYPGFVSIGGSDLALKMFEQTSELKIQFRFEEITNIECLGKEQGFILHSSNHQKVKARFVCLAMGQKPRKPKITSLIAKENKGVSYCAICDGALYKGQETMIIGGGNSAVEESFFLMNISPKVHIVLRRDVFRADASLVAKLKKFDNTEIHYNSLVDEVLGDEEVDGVIIKNVKTDKKTKLAKIKAVFPYIGQIPQVNNIKHLNITNEAGFIPVNKQCETRIKDLYAAGDVVEKDLRQIVTAISDGAIVAKSIVSKSQ